MSYQDYGLRRGVGYLLQIKYRNTKPEELLRFKIIQLGH